MRKFLLQCIVLVFGLGLPACLIAQPAIQWDKTIGGNGNDDLITVQQTPDGGYIVGGTLYAGSGRDKTDKEPGIWLVKMAADGSKQWDKTYYTNL